MGFFLTDQSPTLPIATPKTHGPFSRVEERGRRFYSPELGRWVSRDPIGEIGGFNLCSIVGNEPIGGLDPVGLQQTDPEAPKVDPRDCQCCCVEDLVLFRDREDPRNIKDKIRIQANFRYTATIEFKAVTPTVIKTACDYVIQERSNKDLEGGYRGGSGWADRTEYARGKGVPREFDKAVRSQQSRSIVEAFADTAGFQYPAIESPAGQLPFIVEQKLTIRSSTDKACAGACRYKSVTIEQKTEFRSGEKTVIVVGTDDEGRDVVLSTTDVLVNRKNSKIPWGN